MRSDKGGVAHLSKIFEGDLEERDTGLSRPQRIGLADIVASVLATRSVNTVELAHVLPREVGHEESKQRYLWRWFSDSGIDPLRVMQGLIPDLIKSVTQKGEAAVMMMDQTQITPEFQCLMLSLSFQGRAQPLAWKVVRWGEETLDLKNKNPYFAALLI